MNDNKEREKEFHKDRRMFFIINDTVLVGPKNSSLSHKEWAEKENLLDNNDFEFLVRGFVDKVGIYFYKSNNFLVDSETEKEFFENLPKLIKKLKIDKEINVFGGMIKQEKFGKWPPRKKYGKLKTIIKE